MEVNGKVKAIGQTETVGAKGFQKRLIAVETMEQYPQVLGIEFVQDKTSLLDAVNVGDNVTIGINLRGREWENPQGEIKYFNTLGGWKVTVNEKTQSNEPEPSGNDLPF